MTDEPLNVQPKVIEALLRAHAEGASLEELLRLAPLSPDQRAAADLLLRIHEQARENAADDAPAANGRPIGRAGSRADLERELEDLRRANDTLAEALGACPLCWGGDRGCDVCGGHGQPGYAAPDPKLFSALVLPAARRVRDNRRSKRSARTRRAGASDPFSPEVIR